MYKLIFSLFLLSVLQGCATKAERITLPTPTSSELSFVLIDARHSEQRKTMVRELADSTVQILGDDIVVPNRVDVLADALNRDLKNELRGKTVEVTEFTIRASQFSARARDGAAYDNSPAGQVGAVIGRELWFASGRSGLLTSSANIKARIDGLEVAGFGYSSISASTMEVELAEMVVKSINDFVVKVKSSVDGRKQ